VLSGLPCGDVVALNGPDHRKEEPAGSLASMRDIQSKVFSLQIEKLQFEAMWLSTSRTEGFM
jgi:hypothetical protein